MNRKTQWCNYYQINLKVKYNDCWNPNKDGLIECGQPVLEKETYMNNCKIFRQNSKKHLLWAKSYQKIIKCYFIRTRLICSLTEENCQCRNWIHILLWYKLFNMLSLNCTDIKNFRKSHWLINYVCTSYAEK